MGLEVYYPTDISNAIRAAEQATTAALGDVAGDRYLEGYRAALTTLALAFGLVGAGRQSEADARRPAALLPLR